MKETKQHFDSSDDTRQDQLSDEHEKKLGGFKDELNGRGMSEMLGVNPKAYAAKKSTY